jgi:predicted enzyme related to lactoylglutathione lyase
MHHSRLCNLEIDTPAASYEAAVTFWSQALGMPAGKPEPPEGNYVPLRGRPGGLTIEVQRVSHPSGVHMDIETDDIEAEVKRLEALGAKRLRQVKTWWVMEAPSGHRFCVVRPQSPDFPAGANRWGE